VRIGDLLKRGVFSVSFEFFPPKTEEGERQLFETIEELKLLKPTFVSVTCRRIDKGQDQKRGEENSRADGTERDGAPHLHSPHQRGACGDSGGLQEDPTQGSLWS